MIAALILALAASSVSGVVHDSSGGVVSGAAVIVRPASGPEQQTTDRTRRPLHHRDARRPAR